MIAVPWHVDKTEVSLLPSPEYSRQVVPCSSTSLARAKDRIGELKIRFGTEAWKNGVIATEDKNNKSFKNSMNSRNNRINKNAVSQKNQVTHQGERPLSRAYFKLTEIFKTCIFRPPSVCLLLCEAPGGFCQAILEEFPKTKLVYLTSLQRGGIHFHPSVLKDQRCMHLGDEEMPDASDICMTSVRRRIASHVPPADLITADGAIDSDSFPELTEAKNAHLIACEIETALSCQANGGSFVLKVFSISLPITVQFVALLASCYESVSVVKPLSSRGVNDERYVVCQGFVIDKVPRFCVKDNPSDDMLERIAVIDSNWERSLQSITQTLNLAQESAILNAISEVNARNSGAKNNLQHFGTRKQ